MLVQQLGQLAGCMIGLIDTDQLMLKMTMASCFKLQKTIC